jgi:ABC-type phosphate transport system substrate-binding protein
MLALVMLFCVNYAYAERSQLRVIVNNNVKVKSLSESSVRWIFSMRQTTWEDGSAIKVYVLHEQNPIHQDFCKNVLSMFPYQLERMWNKLAYSGLGEKPILVSDSQEMIDMVSQEPGAIGYVLSSSLPPNMHELHISKEG